MTILVNQYLLSIIFIGAYLPFVVSKFSWLSACGIDVILFGFLNFTSKLQCLSLRTGPSGGSFILGPLKYKLELVVVFY
jgi:hypothetical protein